MPVIPVLSGGLGDLWPLILALVGIAAVLYLSYLFSKQFSKRATRIGAAKYMEVVDRLAVGPDRFLHILRLQDKYLLLGSTAQSIEVLGELDGGELVPVSDKPGGFDVASFKETLQNMISRKK